MKMAFIVYLLDTSTPQRTDVLYCGNCERAAWHYANVCPRPTAVYQQLPPSYFA